MGMCLSLCGGEVLGSGPDRVVHALHFGQGRYEQGAQLVTEAFEISRRVLGNEHPVTIQSMFMRGSMYRFQQQDEEEAESLMEESVQLSRRILGDEHFWTLVYMQSLSNLYGDQGRYEDEFSHGLTMPLNVNFKPGLVLVIAALCAFANRYNFS